MVQVHVVGRYPENRILPIKTSGRATNMLSVESLAAGTDVDIVITGMCRSNEKVNEEHPHFLHEVPRCV